MNKFKIIALEKYCEEEQAYHTDLWGWFELEYKEVNITFFKQRHC